jgi:hypothetical protein
MSDDSDHNPDTMMARIGRIPLAGRIAFCVLLIALFSSAARTERRVAFLKSHGVIETATATNSWPCGPGPRISKYGIFKPGTYCTNFVFRTPDGRSSQFLLPGWTDLAPGTLLKFVCDPKAPYQCLPLSALDSPGDFFLLIALVRVMLEVLGIVFLAVAVVYVFSLTDPTERKRRQRTG